MTCLQREDLIARRQHLIEDLDRGQLLIAKYSRSPRETHSGRSISGVTLVQRGDVTVGEEDVEGDLAAVREVAAGRGTVGDAGELAMPVEVIQGLAVVGGGGVGVGVLEEGLPGDLAVER